MKMNRRSFVVVDVSVTLLMWDKLFAGWTKKKCQKNVKFFAIVLMPKPDTKQNNLYKYITYKLMLNN